MADEFASRAGAGMPALGSVADPARRRWIFAGLVGATTIAMAAQCAFVVASSEIGPLDYALVAVFTLTLPCPAIGMWHALLGFWLLRTARDPVATVIPPAARAPRDGPIVNRIAVAMTMRDEDPVRPFTALAVMRRDLDGSGYGEHFDFFVLSDSTDTSVIAAEEREVAKFHAVFGRTRLGYRRRTHNTGYKGGNIHDFCEQHFGDYKFLLPLDIDSLMTADGVLRLIRIMQDDPQIGILQSLASGLPAESLFARVFGFGHRLGMSCFIYGADWWQADCCQFWGHNAAIRLAPFTVQCRLPVLSGAPPFGGPIICHDQIEAAFMRRANYGVRFLPVQGGSYEGNPPTAPDFVKRNSRWCRGNLQNLRLLGTPGLTTMSRFHLAYMAGKFFTAVAVVIFAVLAALAATVRQPDASFPAAAALMLYVAWLMMYLAPRLVGIIDALIREAAACGGAGRLVAGACVELLFTLLLTPISMIEVTLAILALVSGVNIDWHAQHRENRGLSWREALAAMWRPTMFGAVMLLFLMLTAPAAIPWFLPLLVGLLLSVPFTVATSSAVLGALARRARLCATPEELKPPPVMAEMLPLLLREA